MPSVHTSSSPVLLSFRRACASQPEQTVFTFYDETGKEERTLTRGALARSAGAIARSLREKHGLEPGDHVLLVYPPSLEFVEALVGCMAAGVVPVPVYPPNPFRLAHDLPVFRSLAADCGARLALTTGRYDRARVVGALAGRLGRDSAGWPELTWVRTDRRAADGLEPAHWHLPTDRDDPAFIQYTSGSTSAPKGVVITHGNLAHELAANAADLGMGPQVRGVFWVPQYHDLGLISVILSTVAGNGAVHLFSPHSFLQRPALWFEIMSRVRATHTAAPNFAFDFAARRTTPAERAAWDLSTLRVVMSAAEPVRAATMDAFFAAFDGTGLRPEAFYPSYGLAEHTVSVSMGGGRRMRLGRAALEDGRVAELAPEDAAEGSVHVSCGRITKSDARVRIIDPETRRPCPADRVGEIWVDSPSKALGYHNLPDQSRETFRAQVSDEPDSAQYLRTGDLGFLHDGELFVTGRCKDLIIIRGRNLYPLDVEDSVRDCHPLIRPGGIAAFAVTDPDDPAGGDRLVVFAETRRDRLTEQELQELCEAIRARVYTDHQLPCDAIAVGKQGLVRKTTSGKVRRRACAQAFADAQNTLAPWLLHISRRATSAATRESEVGA